MYDIRILEPILNNLLSSASGIESAAIISTEGLPIASILLQDVNELNVAVMSSVILSLGKRIIQEMEKGEIEQIFIKGNNGYIISMAVSEDAVLTITTTTNVNLGLIFLYCKRTCEKISRLI